ncbi:MAG: glycosyltransferase family 2 protein [bacterium]
MKTLFWISTAGLAYTYLGYPALVWLLARVRPKLRVRDEGRRSVSVVMAAYNEERRLPEKIAALLASEGADRIEEILVGSDGSTDGTAAAVRGCGDARVRVIEFPARRGKPSVLNDLVPQCRADIVVFTDARQAVHPQALGRLLSAFADPAVGVVSGELVFPSDPLATAAASGLNAYWEYEKFIRKNEAAFSSVPGATGALYAMRRELFRPVPPQVLLDDVAIPMGAVAQGAMCVFEEDAIVYDAPSGTPEQESVRKRRTIAGNVQLVVLQPWLLIPWRNPIWFQFVSHKMLRLLSPFFLLAAWFCNVMLHGAAVYKVTLAAQACFYLAAVVGWLAQAAGIRAGLVGMAMMFVSLNVTTLAAWGDALRGRFRVTWAREGGATSEH